MEIKPKTDKQNIAKDVDEFKEVETIQTTELNIQDFKSAFYLGLRKLDEMSQSNVEDSSSEAPELDFE